MRRETRRFDDDDSCVVMREKGKTASAIRITRQGMLLPFRVQSNCDFGALGK
jgi:hypothetical protein